MGKGSLIRGVRGRYAAFTHDLVMVPVAWLGALWLRFNLRDIPDVYLYHALQGRLAFAIKEELDSLEATQHNAVGNEERDLNQIMAGP